MILLEPESLNVDHRVVHTFKVFAQSLLNRLYVGELRYGMANKRKKYLSRLKKEVQEYSKTGNAEQLINIANYAILEWIAPEHPKHHFNPAAKSVTRKEGE